MARDKREKKNKSFQMKRDERERSDQFIIDGM